MIVSNVFVWKIEIHLTTFLFFGDGLQKWEVQKLLCQVHLHLFQRTLSHLFGCWRPLKVFVFWIQLPWLSSLYPSPWIWPVQESPVKFKGALNLTTTVRKKAHLIRNPTRTEPYKVLLQKYLVPKSRVSGTLQGTFPKIFGTKIRGFRNPTRYFFKNIWYQNQGSPEPYKVLSKSLVPKLEGSGTVQGTFSKNLLPI